MDKIEAQIVQYIEEHKEGYIAFMQDLIRIPRITGDEKKEQEFVRTQISEWRGERESHGSP